MTAGKIKDLIRCGETSTVQFKLLFKTAEDIANELVAFSNSKGGSILIGVDDKTGEVAGLDFAQVQKIGSLVANAANDRMHPIVYPDIETVLVDNKAVMIVSVPRGCDAPYTNNKGEIYVKQGCDKRRVTDNNEILRLFANSGTFQPDRQSIRESSINDIDTFALEDFFERNLHRSTDNLGLPFEKALQNLFIIDNEGHLSLGGLMFFGKHPQRFCPAFDIKAVWFYGDSIGGTEYRDSKNIIGTIPKMFEDGMRFIQSCLHRRQEGQNFNSVGILEISEIALTEILQNALVHRSWLKPAPIRILIFDNRVEIISPGALPPTLTVEDIKLGNAFQRNQLVATLCAKTMSYRGLGSGIIRALNADPNIEFHNEISGDQFRVILWRDIIKSQDPVKSKVKKYPESPESSISKEKNYPENLESAKSKEKNYPENPESAISKEKNYPENLKSAVSKEKNYPENLKTTQKIITLIKLQPSISREELAHQCGVTTDAIKLQIRKLRNAGKIRRIGPDKGGHWEVIE